ncbi:MAG TPA: glycine cleavage system protein GcvH [Terriglobales bacterium]|nr:glycine cleavage system protein GcvH [Terriglobales bacterium]
MAYPTNFRYTTEHEWVAAPAAGAKSARFGITDFAQHQLGDIVFVELPQVGASLVAGQAFGTVESVKAVSEVFAPVSGRVTAINADLVKSPELLNSDPHGAAWMIEAELSDPAQSAKLMDSAAYEAFLAQQEAAH